VQLFQNIKINYYSKIIEAQLKEKRLGELLNTLEKLIHTNFDIFHQLSQNALHSILSKYENGNLLDSKLFWINSFELNDATYIKNFLEDYLSHQTNNNEINIENYHDAIIELINNYEFIDKEFDLNVHVNKSYIIQFFKLAVQKNTLQRKIFLNNSSFFQSEKEYAFTHPKLTSGYVLLVKDPYRIYKSMKQNSTSPSIELMNKDDHPIEYKTKKKSLYIYRKGWHTFNQSWSDSNIKDTLDGLIIKYEDLVNNPEEHLSRLIFHLKRTGFDIKVNYDLIEKYIKQNPISLEEDLKYEFSKKELKSLSDLASTAERFQYLPY
jgi:hypothetical protein